MSAMDKLSKEKFELRKVIAAKEASLRLFRECAAPRAQEELGASVAGTSINGGPKDPGLKALQRLNEQELTELEKGFALAGERVKEERARRRYAEKIARLQQ